MAAFRTDTDIKVPDSLQQLRHGHAGIPAAETLSALELKDELQILCLHTVVKEAVVADLLEAGWQHMHQVTADEFRMAERDLAFRAAGCEPICTNFAKSEKAVVGYVFVFQ